MKKLKAWSLDPVLVRECAFDSKKHCVGRVLVHRPSGDYFLVLEAPPDLTESTIFPLNDPARGPFLAHFAWTAKLDLVDLSSFRTVRLASKGAPDCFWECDVPDFGAAAGLMYHYYHVDGPYEVSIYCQNREEREWLEASDCANRILPRKTDLAH